MASEGTVAEVLQQHLADFHRRFNLHQHSIQLLQQEYDDPDTSPRRKNDIRRDIAGYERFLAFDLRVLTDVLRQCSAQMDIDAMNTPARFLITNQNCVDPQDPIDLGGRASRARLLHSSPGPYRRPRGT